MKQEILEVATIVLAGGKGKRLYPLTLHHSKPAVSYGGRYRLIDIPISNAINSRFRQIFVIAQYLSAELEHHVNQTYQFDAFNPGYVDVLTPEENREGERGWFSGTADAVRKNLKTLLKSSAEYFLILSGDQLYNMDLEEMVQKLKEKGADLLIAALPVQEKEAKRMGILSLGKDGWLDSFHEKPKTLGRELLLSPSLAPDGLGGWYLGSMGIYVFKREFLVRLLEEDDREDFGHHLIETALSRGKVAPFFYKGYWEDIGTIDSYYRANLLLADPSFSGLNTYDEKKPIYTRASYLPGPKIRSTHIFNSILCEGSLIEAEEISESIVGLRSKIGKGSVIKKSVLMGNHFYMPPVRAEKNLGYGIGKNCHIERTIIDEHVQIGNGVRLLNREGKRTYDGEGIFIRDGITIVASGAFLPDGFEL